MSCLLQSRDILTKGEASRVMMAGGEYAGLHVARGYSYVVFAEWCGSFLGWWTTFCQREQRSTTRDSEPMMYIINPIHSGSGQSTFPEHSLTGLPGSLGTTACILVRVVLGTGPVQSDK